MGFLRGESRAKDNTWFLCLTAHQVLHGKQKETSWKASIFLPTFTRAM